MQPLTAEQAAVLTCPAPEIDFGCELLTFNLDLLEDISEDVVDGRVERNMNRSPAGQLRLRLSRDLAYPAIVRPWQSIRDTVTGAEFRRYVGAYVLALPEQTEGDDMPLLSAAGDDRTQLLDRPVAADYEALAGVTYRQALVDTFAAAGLTRFLIEGSAADNTLPKDRPWPLIGQSSDPDQTTNPVTWRRVIDDLLEPINFRAVWSDENGIFRCSAYQPPSSRASEYTFDAQDPRVTIVSEQHTEARDVRDVPNRWVFRWTNAPEGTAPEDLIYEYALPDSDPLSAANRGLDWPVVFDYQAATRAKLVELGDRRIAYDLRTTSTIGVNTGPFPVAGHADVFTFITETGSRKVQAASWSFDLSGSDVEWSWEVIA